MADLNVLIEGVNNYHELHYETGGFLRACLENDLYGAAIRADRTSIYHLPDLMRHIANELPAEAWGNAERVKAWLKH